jgi:hypothetical protein
LVGLRGNNVGHVNVSAHIFAPGFPAVLRDVIGVNWCSVCLVHGSHGSVLLLLRFRELHALPRILLGLERVDCRCWCGLPVGSLRLGTDAPLAFGLTWRALEVVCTLLFWCHSVPLGIDGL